MEVDIPKAVPSSSEYPGWEHGGPSHGALPSGCSMLTRLAPRVEDLLDRYFSVVPLVIIQNRTNTGGLTAGWGCVEKIGSEPPAGLSFVSAGGPLLLFRLPEALALSLLKKEGIVVCRA